MKRQIDNLEKSREELREVVRQQKEQLQKYRSLVQQSEGNGEKRERKDENREEKRAGEKRVEINLTEERGRVRTEVRTTEVVRGKKREKLEEVEECRQCREYYEALARVMNVPKAYIVNECSRHRTSHPTVETPPGYWDVGWTD